jgi:MarR family 2-MHQ and catechol resistance regulon transcriptional repressor
MPSKRPGAAHAASRSSPGTALVAQLSMQVQAFARFYQLRNRDRVCRFGLTVSECYALEAIVESGSLSVTALAHSLGLNKSNASRVAERLGRMNLIGYQTVPENARTRLVVATNEGRALAQRIHREIEAEHRQVFAAFAVRDLGACARMLTALLEARRVGRGHDGE